MSYTEAPWGLASVRKGFKISLRFSGRELSNHHNLITRHSVLFRIPSLRRLRGVYGRLRGGVEVYLQQMLQKHSGQYSCRDSRRCRCHRHVGRYQIRHVYREEIGKQVGGPFAASRASSIRQNYHSCLADSYAGEWDDKPQLAKSFVFCSSRSRSTIKASFPFPMVHPACRLYIIIYIYIYIMYKPLLRDGLCSGLGFPKSASLNCNQVGVCRYNSERHQKQIVSSFS